MNARDVRDGRAREVSAARQLAARGAHRCATQPLEARCHATPCAVAGSRLARFVAHPCADLPGRCCFVDYALVACPARLLAETSRDACGALLRTMRAGRATLRAASCAVAAIFVVVAPVAAPESLRRCRDGWSEFF
ncbi:hypothetical protein F511_44235 [Dorcoceras hygrometricum]|uniref:Uncharacterized protein n=1 Tax=Dorcoceras hygrometricum TaxID=472368 RepID=A0A2Z7AEY5_9LAMI|nr:hypothetical protein F511_44235 [Dorcoceras hygrometricum]